MSRLRDIARATAAREAEAPPEPERCELCGELLPSEHRHMIDLDRRRLMCSCRACSLLFDTGAAGGGHFKLVPDRRLRIEDFDLDDVRWAELAIPVDMAFFFRHSGEDRVVAFYPGPAGATESLLELGAWAELEEANPVLRTLEDDVEALLVNRARGARGYYLVPIEDPYRLVALIGTHWRGLTGGSEVWQEIEGFFAGLDDRAATTPRKREETAWQS